MKITKTNRRIYDPETHKLIKSEEVELDMVDAAGVLLEEGQKVWYARASKSAPAQLFRAEIINLTTDQFTLSMQKLTGMQGKQ